MEDKEERLIPRLLREPILGDMIREVMQEAMQEAELRGEQRGEQRGQQKAIAELLGRLFARRVGRQPTTDEERALLERAQAIGAGEVEDALLDLEGDALVRWLAEPVGRT